MKKLFFGFSIFALLTSCGGKDESEILYTQYDDEYSDIQTFAFNDCVDEAEVFTSFNSVGEFDNSEFAVGDIFKLIHDTSSAFYSYFQITSINANDMVVTINSNNDAYDMILTFEESDHDSIEDFFKQVACNISYDDYFSNSSLESSTTFTFNWFKETVGIADDDDDGDDEVYNYVTESLTASTAYPLFMFFFNGTKKHQYDLTNDDEDNSTTITSTLTISEVTGEEECDSSDSGYDSTCEFASVTRNCALEVDDTVVSTRAHTTTPLSLSGDADCLLPPSADIGTWTN